MPGSPKRIDPERFEQLKAGWDDAICDECFVVTFVVEKNGIEFTHKRIPGKPSALF